MTGGDGDSRHGPATTDRSDEDVEIRNVVEELERDRSLTGDHCDIVERRQQLVTPLGGQLRGRRAGRRR